MTYKTGLMILAAFIAGIYVLFSIGTRAPEGASHQVYVDGVVITMDADNTVSEAVSVRDVVLKRWAQAKKSLRLWMKVQR